MDLASYHPEHQIHVVRAVDVDGSSTARTSLRDLALEAAHRTLEREVEYVVTNLGDSEPDLSRWKLRTHVVAGPPEEEIAALAADVRADLIVLGRHGEQGRFRRFAGSVPERLLRIARCPVLVVQPPDYDGAPSLAPDEVACDDCRLIRQESGGEHWFCQVHADGRAWRTSLWRPQMAVTSDRGGSVWF
jgi:nucleotide-binding universal stress UspA family protein